MAAIAARVGVSVGSVSAVLRAPGPAQASLPLPAAPPPVADPTPPTVPATPQPVRYAGALLLLGALEALGFFQAFQSLGASVGRAWRYDWARTVAVVALVFALRLRSIERLKTVLPTALGPLVGCRRAPHSSIPQGRLVGAPKAAPEARWAKPAPRATTASRGARASRVGHRGRCFFCA